jgi:hypothetical protein
MRVPSAVASKRWTALLNQNWGAKRIFDESLDDDATHCDARIEVADEVELTGLNQQR